MLSTCHISKFWHNERTTSFHSANIYSNLYIYIYNAIKQMEMILTETNIYFIMF